MEQTILTAENGCAQLDAYWRDTRTKSVFLVCGRSADGLAVGRYFAVLPARLSIRVVRFSDFSPNPDWASAQKAADAFQESGCDMIAAVGGGSAMDVAKCVRLWRGGAAKLLAVPTTAGSGSEATHFAVVYRDGKKQSIADEACRPNAVLLDPSVLATLPLYHKRSAMLDALCHGVESFWSVHATQESQALAAQAIEMILAHYQGYLAEGRDGAVMLRAAHLAGKAIDITQTTAAHAMSYQLTKRCGLAHGHAAAVCAAALWLHLLENCERRADPALGRRLQSLARAMGCGTAVQAAARFAQLLDELKMEPPRIAADGLDQLAASVALERLKNYPVQLEPAAIRALYREMCLVTED